MARINGLGGTFPYSEDHIEAPYSDGIVSSVDDSSSPYMPTLGGLSSYTGQTRPDTGKVKNYIGGTSCVDTNTTWHAVFAGDF